MMYGVLIRGRLHGQIAEYARHVSLSQAAAVAAEAQSGVLRLPHAQEWQFYALAVLDNGMWHVLNGDPRFVSAGRWYGRPTSLEGGAA